MTLKLAKPTGAKLLMRPAWQPMDSDAAAYITAVETADGQALEEKTKIAIDNFVLGCKADGIWTAIKASCILAGARTLSGALVPLAGTAPTNVGGLFVQADYNRKTGLAGNGSTKYLNSSRLSDADPQDNCHLAAYVASAGGAAASYIGGSNNFGKRLSSNSVRLNSSTTSFSFTAAAPCLLAASRSQSASYLVRNNGATSTAAAASSYSGSVSMAVFATNNSGVIAGHADARIAFYSIGESLNLVLLDARVTDLINAFGAAIP